MKTTIVRVWLLGTLYILEEIHLFKFERLQWIMAQASTWY